MDRRLDAIFRQIRPGRGVIDVGTDHGCVPAALAASDYPGNILASDIRPGPLEAAKRTAEQAGVRERIRFLLCDGLDDCPRDAVDTIVIAGMGGDTICGILDRAEWCMTPAYTLVLQPMTKPEVLRYWLINNGFRITNEELVRDGETIYQILTAMFSENSRLRDAELFVGASAIAKDRELYRDLIDQQIRRFQTRVDGLTRASAGETDPALCLQRRLLEQMREMRDDLYAEGL